MSNEYRICSRCIMDTTDPEIQFDENGYCNHCRKYERRVKTEQHYDEEGQERLKKLLEDIKEKGRNKKYDCIIGVSGGVDSTFVAYTVKQMGLRPLAVHLDNGWDSELAVNNIEKILKKLDIDLYTHVLDWEEFKDLQLSFLKSSFINAEIPTDHAIVAVLLKVAAEKKVKFILGGSNIATEGIHVPAWVYDYRDWRLTKAIQKKFGKYKLKTFPHFNLFNIFYYLFLKRIKFIPILNYVKYNKKEALDVLVNELGWKYYGGKHYESIYTRFYQSYILPVKYDADKRKAHMSALIMAGEMTREQALEELKKETYPADLMAEDKEYAAKKFNMTMEEFDELLALPIKSYQEYPNNSFVFKKLPFLMKFAKRIATYNSKKN
ncbi:MAG: N-acetyl sugar amidotransferase [bacterium]|nr:N-acetyl sugar amidotransferase [bacterium]